MADEVKNIVLIVVDALREDHVGAYSGNKLTPNIDSLADDGEVFENCFSCINATDSSVTTILTGLYPTRHGVINHGQGITKEEQEFVAGTKPLPDLLDSSHESIGVDTLERWHQRGFDTYINPRQQKQSDLFKSLSKVTQSLPEPLENSIRGLHNRLTTSDIQVTRGTEITDAAVDGIEMSSSPFFLFTHYWDAHLPYIPISEHPKDIQGRSYEELDESIDDMLAPIEGSPWASRLKENFTGEAKTVSDLKRKYDAGVLKADQAIGALVDKLKTKELYDETAIIVTADHGESFTEHGILFDHHGLYDETIHVPLIIKAPGFDGREAQFVQHFDIVPTILDLLNKDYQEDQFDGVSLVSEDMRTLGREAVFAEEGHTARKRTIRTHSYKYIKRLDDQTECRYCGIRHAPNNELYDLEADPEENTNIIDDRPGVIDRLDTQLNSWIEQLPPPTKENTTFEASQEVKDHLEEMGYL